MNRTKVRSLLAVVLLVAVAGACSVLDPESPRERETARIDAAQAKWKATNPHNYSFTYKAVCFCSVNATDSVRIIVRADTIYSQTYIKNGQAPTGDFAHVFPTVEDMFVLLRHAISTKADKIDVVYDSYYGFPSTANIDYSFQIADEEYGFVVTDFHADGQE